MKPIGLTLKNIKTNPFTGRTDGELMIVHQCVHCGKISCNRIAGDDNPYAVTSVLENTIDERGKTNRVLISHGINLLAKEHRSEVMIVLYGYNY